MALSKVESASLIVGAGKGFRDTTGIDLGPGWLEAMLTTALFVGGAARSVKNTIAPKAETLGEAVLYADELASEDVQDQMLIGAIPAVFYGAAKAGFFMGLGYSAGYVAGQFLTK